MIEGIKYVEVVQLYFRFLIEEFNCMILEEKIKGEAFYEVKYLYQEKVISISYENTEDYLQVIIFILEQGKLPKYDDKSKTLHLQQLNASVFSKIDSEQIVANNEVFSMFFATNVFEKQLLKYAKELRLCLLNVWY